MLHIAIVAVGGLKEKYFLEACREYQKRLGAFCKLSIVEVSEHRLPLSPSAAEIERGVFAEGAFILKKLGAKSAVIPLCVEGERLSSAALAKRLDKIGAENPGIEFVIGGSHGLSPSVMDRAAFSLSMSDMTFPHQLARVMLLEQLYRSFTILNGMKYHK